MDIAYPVAGFAVGALAGLTGMGGGSVMTPLLILVFGVAPATVVGTDLLFAAVTKSAVANVHAWRGNVEWRVVGLLAAGSMPAALATVWLIRRLPPHSPALEHAITAGHRRCAADRRRGSAVQPHRRPPRQQIHGGTPLPRPASAHGPALASLQSNVPAKAVAGGERGSAGPQYGGYSPCGRRTA